ncbi:MAG: hypothetical protein ACO2PN_18100 [Pyrobaculum sp.]|jgi:hypothetical protein
MSCASALEAARPAALLSGIVNTRRAMMRKPDIDPSVLIHRDLHTWVEPRHIAASAARHTTPLRPRRDTPLVD